jgi:hypothetical protein
MSRTRAKLAALLASLLSVPALAQICTPFIDVPASDPFCADIQWMLNRGVTLGCHEIGQPPAYCPAQFVRRDQMAAFMFRLGHDVVFQDGGNAFGNAAVLGTTDNNALDIQVNSSRVMRYEPNTISPNVIGGHPANGLTPDVYGATIAGGGLPPGGNSDPNFGPEAPNRVTDAYGTVGGGLANVAGDDTGAPTGAAFATVGGGFMNTASNTGSTVAGGLENTASGHSSTVAGGVNNTASGSLSTVAGGQFNVASGSFSFAAGRRAKALTVGSFVWADTSNFDFQPSLDNQFAVRATGAVSFVVAVNASGGPTEYCNLIPGDGGWSCVSDRNVKENFEPVDGDEVLAKLVAMPMASWNFRGADPAIRNLGPTAQDFQAAFHLGRDDKTIASSNLHGVALAAIQGLNAKLESVRAAKDAEIAALRAELGAIRSVLAKIAEGRPTQTAVIGP